VGKKKSVGLDIISDVMSEVPRESVLGLLLFLTYVNDIWMNIESTIRLFTDDCIIYIKIVNNLKQFK
jgi:hypothetical protein